MFPGYVIIQLFCSYNMWHVWCYFQWQTLRTFTLVHPAVCALWPVRLLVCSFLVCFQLCFSDIFWMIFRWFHLILFFLVSLLFLHSTCAAFLLWRLRILKYFRLLSWRAFKKLPQNCAQRLFASSSLSFQLFFLHGTARLVFVEF